MPKRLMGNEVHNLLLQSLNILLSLAIFILSCIVFYLIFSEVLSVLYVFHMNVKESVFYTSKFFGIEITRLRVP